MVFSINNKYISVNKKYTIFYYRIGASHFQILDRLRIQGGRADSIPSNRGLIVNKRTNIDSIVIYFWFKCRVVVTSVGLELYETPKNRKV